MGARTHADVPGLSARSAAARRPAARDPLDRRDRRVGRRTRPLARPLCAATRAWPTSSATDCCSWPATATSRTPTTAISTSPGPSTRCAPARRSRRPAAAPPRQVAVLDTGRRRRPPGPAGRLATAFDTRPRGQRRDRSGRARHLRGRADLGGRRQRPRRQGRGRRHDRHPGPRLDERRLHARRRAARPRLRGPHRGRRGQPEPGRATASAPARPARSRLAFFNDVLPVAASGNRALDGNPLEFPAAFLGGAAGHRASGCRWRPRCRTTSPPTSRTTTTS